VFSYQVSGKKVFVPEINQNTDIGSEISQNVKDICGEGNQQIFLRRLVRIAKFVKDVNQKKRVRGEPE
jgi:hypothetical protein